jgi:type I restriction enzyme S subunit
MMKKYPLYKNSEIESIGEIPDGWKISKVKWELDFHNNKRVPIESVERFNRQGKYPYYGASGIIDFVDDFIFEGEFILVGEDGANILSRSTPLAFLANGKFWVNNHAHILKAKYGNDKFYCHQLELNDFSSISSGSAQPKLTKEALANVILVTPSPKEQDLIINFLDHQTSLIDTIISKKEKLIELLKEKRQAVINEAVTKGLDPNAKMKDSGVEWLGEIPEGWEVVKLKHVADISFSSVDRHEIETEISVSICHYPNAYKNDKLFLDTDLSVGTCSESEFEKYQLRKGQVIITKDSESANDIGIPTYVTETFENAVCGYHLAILDSKSSLINGEYLFRFLQTNVVKGYFETESNGVTRFGLGKPSIENLYVPLVSVDVQFAIIKRINAEIDKLDLTSSKITLQIEKLKEYRQSLISEAVTGKIDVREWEPLKSIIE